MDLLYFYPLNLLDGGSFLQYIIPPIYLLTTEKRRKIQRKPKSEDEEEKIAYKIQLVAVIIEHEYVVHYMVETSKKIAPFFNGGIFVERQQHFEFFSTLHIRPIYKPIYTVKYTYYILDSDIHTFYILINGIKIIIKH